MLLQLLPVKYCHSILNYLLQFATAALSKGFTPLIFKISAVSFNNPEKLRLIFFCEHSIILIFQPG